MIAVSRDKFIRILGQNSKCWAARFDLEPFSHPCAICGKLFITTIPFFSGQFRGLIAPVCECGNRDTPYCLVRDPRFGDLFSEEDKIASARRVSKRKARRPRLRLVPPVGSHSEGVQGQERTIQ